MHLGHLAQRLTSRLSTPSVLGSGRDLTSPAAQSCACIATHSTPASVAANQCRAVGKSAADSDSSRPEDVDGLSPARGVLVGVVLGAGLWALAAAAWLLASVQS